MEIKPQWNQPIMRMQSMARKQDGLSIIKAVIVVNADGVPLYWIPTIMPIEPKINANIDMMKKNMKPEEMENLLHLLLRMNMT